MKMNSLRADLLRRLDLGLEPLSRVPDGVNYVRKAEYRKLEEQVWTNQNKVDSISSTLLEGFNTEFTLLLGSRPTRTQIEDMLALKCDKELVGELEGRILEQESRFEDIEARLAEMQETVVQTAEGLGDLKSEVESRAALLLEAKLSKEVQAEPEPVLKPIIVIGSPPRKQEEQTPQSPGLTSRTLTCDKRDFTLEKVADGLQLPSLRAPSSKEVLDYVLKQVAAGVLELTQKSKVATEEAAQVRT